MAKTGSILRSLLLKLFSLGALLLIILAVYVSLGRQLIPLVSNYQPEIERRLTAALGMPVQVAAVHGGWSRLNPALTLEQLEVSVQGAATGADPQRAALVESLTLELNVLRSLLRWELVLKTVNIDGLAFDFVEQQGGSWQLAGVNRGGSIQLDGARLFELASRFGNLELLQTRLNFHFLSGQSHSLNEGRLHFQSRASQHFLHLDATWADGEALSLSAELQGDRYEDLSGQLYLLLPPNDYSPLLGALAPDAAGRAIGGVELWADVVAGQLGQLQAELNVSELSWQMDEAVHLSNLQGSFLVRRSARAEAPLPGLPAYDFILQDFSFDWERAQWPASNLMLVQNREGIEFQADVVNAAIVSAGLQLAPAIPPQISQALQTLDPRGLLQDMHIQTSWNQGQAETVQLQTNLAGVNFNAMGGVPAIWGIAGYAELEYQAQQARLTGFAEVDSTELMLHLPRLFLDPWVYQHVNGRINLDLDISNGINMQLGSSVIAAESEIIDGHARFQIDYVRTADAQPTGTLELIVGAKRADASFKQAYLPLAPNVAPNIRSAMEWVNMAVRSGQISNSGLIYRGSIIKGAAPVDRTLQMVYEVSDGHLQFDRAWPALEKLDGIVRINNREVDIDIFEGESAGVELGFTRASVRRGAEGSGNWVLVNGTAGGSAARALDYLRSIPPAEGFAPFMADWQTQGPVNIGLQLALPLAVPGAQRQVQVNVGLANNELTLPELDLQFFGIEGKLVYHLDTGLRSENLSAEVLGGLAEVRVSAGAGAENTGTVVELDGRTTIDDISAWELNTPLSLALLEYAQGGLDYQATYRLPYVTAGDSSGSAPVAPSLSVHTDLQDVVLDLPAPLQKATGSSLPVSLEIDFEPEGPRLRGSIRDIMTADLNLLQGGGIRNGLLFLGPRDESLPIRRFNSEAPGLEVLGRLGQIDYAAWTDVMTGAISEGAVGASSLRNFAHLADIQIDELKIFGQSIHDLDIHLSTAEELELVLASDFIAGTIRIPPDPDGYLDLQLAHLRIPADPEASSGVDAPVQPEDEESVIAPAERVDPFAGIDPRRFPRLRFRADEIMIGDADYGQWQLQLEPQEDGALFTNLQINSRGLQIGVVDQGAEFFWGYDGQTHVSQLQAQVETGNLGEVLSAFGYAPSLESERAIFSTDLGWTGSPGNFSALALRGGIDLQIFNGRFLQGGAGTGSSALKLISILNFDALVRRLRFSDDLLRAGLAYDEINGSLLLNEGIVTIADRLQIIGPSSLFQIRGDINLHEETIDGSMYITLPVSDNIPWLGGLAALNNLINWQVAVGVFIFDRLFSEQMDNLTSAQYLLKGPWEGLEPRLNQVFTAGGGRTAPADIVPAPSGPVPEAAPDNVPGDLPDGVPADVPDAPL